MWQPMHNAVKANVEHLGHSRPFKYLKSRGKAPGAVLIPTNHSQLK